MGNLLDVIKYEGDNETLVHKSYIEDFNSKSQLIVNEAQEAIFYKDGQALDLFGSGRHSLNTNNLPVIKRIFGAIFGGKTPFSCEVFFINKITRLDIIWGTDTPIQLEDPKYHLLVGASVVDADYQGEVHLNVHNTGNQSVTIFSGQKLVQFIHKYYINTDWQEISNEQYNEIQVSDRGAGGFGSSGIN